MLVDSASNALTCRHCGTYEESPALVPNLEIVGASANSCPTCRTPLSDGRLESHPVLFCQGCLGVLIDMGHFVSVIEAVRVNEARTEVLLPRGQNPGERLLNCPGCGQIMLSHIYLGPGNLVIDTCERCRLNWLDAGELRKIARAPSGVYPKT
jgi:Zn-finger nucleic acid-binding protein